MLDSNDNFDIPSFFASNPSQHQGPYRNRHGNDVQCAFVMTGMDGFGSTRYAFDFHTPEGWNQYDTDQDASYFGVWYNAQLRQTVTFAEGDWTWVQCQTPEGWDREVGAMSDFYGSPPPAAIGYDLDGSRTEYYDSDARPA